MVPPVRREDEYSRNPAFEAFFVEEVVPAVDARCRTHASASGRAVGGISWGGLAALSLALGHPDVFGACIAQSSAPGKKLGDLFDLARAAPRPLVSVWIDVGVFESDLNGRDLLDQSRRLRDELTSRGYRLKYLEVNEGHSWGSWRARMREAIAFVWGDAR
jgi:enterochelin esterase-like enzyme